MNEALPTTDLEQLDEYSRFAVGRILERFPAWRDHMILRRSEGYEHAFAEFELLSPSAAIDRGLWVSTADEEITVGMHTHHSHFTAHEDRFDQQHIIDALDHVQEILDERCIIVSWYVADRFVCSTCRDVAPEHTASSLRGGITRRTLRSWRGTYDRDVKSSVKAWLERIF